jgi:signal transduction histidine kinase
MARAARGALVAGMLLCAAVTCPAHAAWRVHVLEQGDFVSSDAEKPPPDDAPWKPVRLPDNWYFSHPGPIATGWYRLPFDLSANELGVHSIYLPRNSARGIRLVANDKLIGGNGGYGDPGSRNWALPTIHNLAPSNLVEGRNYLYVRVTAVPEVRQGLGRVYICEGPSGRFMYDRRLTLQVTTLFMFGAAAFLAGLLALAFWFRERHEPTLAWYAVTAFAWAVASAPWMHSTFTPQHFGHGALAFIARFAYAAPMLVLCLRVAGKRWPVWEGALWAFTLIGAVLVEVLSEEQGFIITAWSFAYLSALIVLLAVLIRSHPGGRRWVSWMFAAAILLVVLLNVYDLARWMGWIDYDSLTLSHFHIPLVLFAIGAAMIERHFRAVAAMERTNVELEKEVAAKAREIEAGFARVQEAEREKTLARERQRIMADMHDGVGSSLIGLLGAVQSGKAAARDIERRLVDALQELRLAVDALEPVDGDLGVVLGNVRHRMRSAIEDSGVQFQWRVDELPRLAYLTPQAILAVQRIILEALTNALRHAGAHTVTVKAKSENGWLLIEIADDGVGFDEPGGARGRGLGNLRRRASGLGATVDIRSARGAGTSVSLRLPLVQGVAS